MFRAPGGYMRRGVPRADRQASVPRNLRCGSARPAARPVPVVEDRLRRLGNRAAGGAALGAGLSALSLRDRTGGARPRSGGAADPERNRGPPGPVLLALGARRAAARRGGLGTTTDRGAGLDASSTAPGRSQSPGRTRGFRAAMARPRAAAE